MNNIFKTTFLMTLLMLGCLFMGDMVGGRDGLVYAFIFGGLGNFIAYWFSDRMVLWSSGAKPADESQVPQVYRVVRTLATAMGIPTPKVYLMETRMPNAFATGRNPNHAAVAVTTGILDILDERELTGVLGHELSHIQHRDILLSTVAGVMAGAIMVLARMAQWALIFGGGGGRDRDRRGPGPVGYILMLVLAPLAATLIQLAISRSREFHADEGGAKLTGDPLALADALRKIEASGRLASARPVSPVTAHLYIINPLSREGMQRLFSTHPPTEERVARLEAMAVGSR